MAPAGRHRVSLRPASCQYRSSNRCSPPTTLGRKTSRTAEWDCNLPAWAGSSQVAARNYCVRCDVRPMRCTAAYYRLRPGSGPSFRRRAFAARQVCALAGAPPRSWSGALPPPPPPPPPRSSALGRGPPPPRSRILGRARYPPGRAPSGEARNPPEPPPPVSHRPGGRARTVRSCGAVIRWEVHRTAQTTAAKQTSLHIKMRRFPVH